jgi:hypothetical protein
MLNATSLLDCQPSHANAEDYSPRMKDRMYETIRCVVISAGLHDRSSIGE